MEDNSENIKNDISNKFAENISSNKFNLEKLVEPEANLINFDDLIFSDIDNSVVISPNRYAGVAFYSPNAQTWLTHFRRYSYPNSLIVGNMYAGSYDIHSVSSLHIDFAQAAQDVSFIWGTDGGYNSGQVYIYNESNQLVTTVPVNFSGYQWISLSLNQYHQRIKKIILVRPSVTNTIFGHIHLDNFQFTPVSTSSPVGYLDGVSITNPIGAFGWSVDPDNNSAGTFVDCYVDSVTSANFIGRVIANNPSPDLPQYPGGHRFRMTIPNQYRDGNQHQMYCYGLDVTGGDPPTLLTGSPKTFRFFAPTGAIDGVDADGYAYGWSRDPDIPAQSNTVHFYIDGFTSAGFAGTTNADIPRSDTLPGNHGYRFYIPAQYRDNQPHTIYAYGIDLTGNQPKILQGSPKHFNLSPEVLSVRFESIYNEVIASELVYSEIDRPSQNFNTQRIFPDRLNPNDTVNHKKVRVRASVGRPNVRVYFKNFDVDDPTDDETIDDNGIDGNDNREGRTIIYGQPNPYPPSAAGTLSATSVLTDANGEAVVYFTVTKQPGDNFLVASSTDETYLNSISVNGTGLKDSINNVLPTNKGKRTELLTVWRKLHVEIDSMGQIGNNLINGYIGRSIINVGQEPVWVNIEASTGSLTEGRFRATYAQDGTIIRYGGRMTIANQSELQVLDNTESAVKVRSQAGVIQIRPNYIFALFDDDDFNGNDGQLWRGDDGENVSLLSDTLSLLQTSDNVSSNPFAEAYIIPEYDWAIEAEFNQTNIPFESHYPRTDEGLLELEKVNKYRDSKNSTAGVYERDDFWVGYLLIAYQSVSGFEYDPSYYPPLDLTRGFQVVGGVAPAINREIDVVDGTIDSRGVPRGSLGAIIYIESMRDMDSSPNLAPDRINFNSRIQVAPHEIGHQFGLKGDSNDPYAGVMANLGITNSFHFNSGHINLMRWRIKSPGEGGQ